MQVDIFVRGWGLKKRVVCVIFGSRLRHYYLHTRQAQGSELNYSSSSFRLVGRSSVFVQSSAIFQSVLSCNDMEMSKHHMQIFRKHFRLSNRKLIEIEGVEIEILQILYIWPMRHTQLQSSAPRFHAQPPRCVSTRTFASSCETMECVEVGRNQMQSEDCCLENPLKYLVTEAASLLLAGLQLLSLISSWSSC